MTARTLLLIVGIVLMLPGCLTWNTHSETTQTSSGTFSLCQFVARDSNGIQAVVIGCPIKIGTMPMATRASSFGLPTNTTGLQLNVTMPSVFVGESWLSLAAGGFRHNVTYVGSRANDIRAGLLPTSFGTTTSSFILSVCGAPTATIAVDTAGLPEGSSISLAAYVPGNLTFGPLKLYEFEATCNGWWSATPLVPVADGSSDAALSLLRIQSL